MSSHAILHGESARLLHGGGEEDVLLLRHSQAEQMDLNQTALLIL